MENLKVTKRDGTIEKFDASKIERVVIASGLTKTQAKKLSEVVYDWVRSQNLNKITSLRLRDKVIEEAQKMDKYAADLYIWYQKTRDKEK